MKTGWLLGKESVRELNLEEVLFAVSSKIKTDIKQSRENEGRSRAGARSKNIL